MLGASKKIKSSEMETKPRITQGWRIQSEHKFVNWVWCMDLVSAAMAFLNLQYSTHLMEFWFT